MVRVLRKPVGLLSAGEKRRDPWARQFGSIDANAGCSHCGEPLTRWAVIADDGSVWGRECYRTEHNDATAESIARRMDRAPKKRGPRVRPLRWYPGPDGGWR